MFINTGFKVTCRFPNIHLSANANAIINYIGRVNNAILKFEHRLNLTCFTGDEKI